MSNRLEQIKNEYAKSHNYVCWDQFISDQPNYKKDQAYNDVYIVYATECCKATLEKASRNGLLLVSDQVLQTSKNIITFFEKYENGTVRRKVEIDRRSIVDESNITLL